MSSEMDAAALRAEFDMLNVRAGISHPEDRIPHMFESFVALRGVLAELHRPWAYGDEPAATVRLLPKEG